MCRRFWWSTMPEMQIKKEILGAGQPEEGTLWHGVVNFICTSLSEESERGSNQFGPLKPPRWSPSCPRTAAAHQEKRVVAARSQVTHSGSRDQTNPGHIWTCSIIVRNFIFFSKLFFFFCFIVVHFGGKFCIKCSFRI